MKPEQIADEAIELFLEYRDVHGYSEQDARVAVVRDVVEAMEALRELEKIDGN